MSAEKEKMRAHDGMSNGYEDVRVFLDGERARCK